MGLAGNLETMALPEILQWAAYGRKTGTLTVESGVLQKRVVFQDGVLVSSSSNDPREALGQFLLRGRLASEEHIFNGLLRQEKEGRLLGEILIDEGVLEEEGLSIALAEQTAETVYDLFLWVEGAFVFEEQEKPNPRLPGRDGRPVRDDRRRSPDRRVGAHPKSLSRRGHDVHGQAAAIGRRRFGERRSRHGGAG